MADVTYTPVDGDPWAGVMLTPVDRDPFAVQRANMVPPTYTGGQPSGPADNMFPQTEAQKQAGRALVDDLGTMAHHVIDPIVSAVMAPGDILAGKLTPNDPRFVDSAIGAAGLLGAGPLASAEEGTAAARMGFGGSSEKAALDMSPAARLARAKDLGFYTNMPVRFADAPADEKIAAAALNVDGQIFTGASHLDAMLSAEHALGKPFDERQQAPIVDGFVTNSGRFVSRWDAGDIAKRASQGQSINAFGADRGAASEDIAPQQQPATSPVRTGATAPGLPGGQGIWGSLGSAQAQTADAGPENALVVRDLAQLRSPQAAFDPAQRMSSNLLAARGNPLALAAGEEGALSSALTQPQIIAYHGSPHDFDRFDFGKIGTGEGAQAYGHGGYFAENEAIAKTYRDVLSNKAADFMLGNKPYKYDDLATEQQRGAFDHIVTNGGDIDKSIDEAKEASITNIGNPDESDFWIRRMQTLQSFKNNNFRLGGAGKMYQVGINADPEHFLDWDSPVSQQHPIVRGAVGKMAPGAEAALPKSDPANILNALKTSNSDPSLGMTGEDVYRKLLRTSDPAAVAKTMRSSGVQGIKYLDAWSRDIGTGSRNYVVFDDKTIDILKKYGLAGIGLGGASVASGALQSKDQSQ